MTQRLLILQSVDPPSVGDAAVAERFVALKGEPAHLACVWLADEQEVPANGLAPGSARYLCDPLTDTGEVSDVLGALSVVAFDVPAADEAQFEDWYQGEHVGLLMQVPGWCRVRRYRVPADACHGPRWTHLALHEIAGPDVMDRPERAAARKTPRRDALAQKPWFARSGRWLYGPADDPAQR